METNEINGKIAEWLGISNYEINPLKSNFPKDQIKRVLLYDTLDFLHDRNQQKWIIDELVKRNYWLIYTYSNSDKTWVIQIHKVINEGRTDFRLIQVRKKNESKDQAFIECVLELINQEEKK